MVAGDEPDPRVRARLRSSGVSAVLWAPFDDTELTFVLKSAIAARGDLARRREIRVPIDVTARLRSGDRREVAVLSSLSQRGAFIELSDPLRKGELIQLEFELASMQFRFFAEVVHRETDDSDCPFPNSGNGVVFYGAERGHRAPAQQGHRGTRQPLSTVIGAGLRASWRPCRGSQPTRML